MKKCIVLLFALVVILAANVLWLNTQSKDLKECNGCIEIIRELKEYVDVVAELNLEFASNQLELLSKLTINQGKVVSNQKKFVGFFEELIK